MMITGERFVFFADQPVQGTGISRSHPLTMLNLSGGWSPSLTSSLDNLSVSDSSLCFLAVYLCG